MTRKEITILHEAERQKQLADAYKIISMLTDHSEMLKKQLAAVKGRNFFERVKAVFRSIQETEALIMIHAAEFVAKQADAFPAQKTKKAK